MDLKKYLCFHMPRNHALKHEIPLSITQRFLHNEMFQHNASKLLTQNRASIWEKIKVPPRNKKQAKNFKRFHFPKLLQILKHFAKIISSSMKFLFLKSDKCHFFLGRLLIYVPDVNGFVNQHIFNFSKQLMYSKLN